MPVFLKWNDYNIEFSKPISAVLFTDDHTDAVGPFLGIKIASFMIRA